MLSAYYPVFYLNSFEYDRTKQKIEGIADLLRTDNKKVRIYTWNCVEGLMEKTPEGSLYKGEEYDEPEMTLKYIYKNENREIKDIFILEDLSNYIEEDKIKYYIRKIRACPAPTGCRGKARQSPSGLAGSASSPHCEEPFWRPAFWRSM